MFINASRISLEHHYLAYHLEKFGTHLLFPATTSEMLGGRSYGIRFVQRIFDSKETKYSTILNRRIVPIKSIVRNFLKNLINV